MLLNKLPEKLDPKQMCRAAPLQGTHVTGSIALGKLNNLVDELKIQASTEVVVDLIFATDEDGFCCIEGTLTADLPMICQRCLEPMILSVNAPIKVSPVASDTEAKRLPSQYEPLMVAAGEISLKEWIAEELHLALPLVARHDTPCGSVSADS